VTAHRRNRLTIAAAVAVVAFAAIWALNLGGGQCGNADTVECTTLGWALLYGWMAMALFTVALVLLVAVLWAAEAVRRVRRRQVRPHHSTRTS
jgi:uncharacterized membrane protein